MIRVESHLDHCHYHLLVLLLHIAYFCSVFDWKIQLLSSVTDDMEWVMVLFLG